ncbi:Polyketide synthase PksG [Pyrenophora tritici-repentis]|nr:Polyketide synthase PksG [Pyrenophora tritici-repentis]
MAQWSMRVSWPGYARSAGCFITLESLASPSYWVKNLLSPVLFTDAVTSLVSERKQVTRFFVEIGPQSALRRPVKDILTHLGEGEDKWSYAAVLNPRQPDIYSLLETVGALWSIGLAIDLNKPNKPLSSPQPSQSLSPTFPHIPFRVPGSTGTNLASAPSTRTGPSDDTPSSAYGKNDFNSAQPTWHHKIRLAEAPWILDHALEGSPLYPALACSSWPSKPRDSCSRQTRPLAGISSKTIRVELESEASPETDARKARWASSVGKEHASAAAQCTLNVQSEQLYENLSKKSGFDYGPYFQGLWDIRYSRNGVCDGNACATGLREDDAVRERGRLRYSPHDV